MNKYLFFPILSLLAISTFAQRTYREHSLLSSGTWYRISIDRQGVYAFSAAMLKTAGIQLPVQSDRLKLYGSGGQVLPEANRDSFPDDLNEVSILLDAGQDGTFEGSDRFYFYAPGPNRWKFQPADGSFSYLKNPYSDKSYYYLNILTSPGARMDTAVKVNTPGELVTSFDEHVRYETDSFNFLRSGQEWFGETLNTMGSGISVRDFNLTEQAAPGEPFQLLSDLAGRSAERPNRIEVLMNGQVIAEHSTAPLVGTLIEQAANQSQVTASGTTAAGPIKLGFRFNGGSINANAWLNYFELHFKRQLNMQGLAQFGFRDASHISPGRISRFKLTNATADTKVWRVTNPGNPKVMQTTWEGQQLLFDDRADQFEEYIAFEPAKAYTPALEGPIANQDLHAMTGTDMVIITAPFLKSEASRLASFHEQKDGLSVAVVEPMNIYHEFASGTADPTAIRNFMKMLYDRAIRSGTKPPRYLLLFGSASYAFKGPQASKDNPVPSYQSRSSLDPLTSYVTDDYYGYLDVQEDINEAYPLPQMDLSIGRIPARTMAQARMAVDKILAYHDTSTLGSWRNEITLVADDEDFNLHLNDAEYHAGMITGDAPVWNIGKRYLDAYVQESGSGGSRYPLANKDIRNRMKRGNLLWNYSGHGSSNRLAQETIVDKDEVGLWENAGRLPLMVTATCDFAPFDDPFQFSLGEDLLTGRRNGAIGLLTTTRLVFASSNKLMNHGFLQTMLTQNNERKYRTLGEALQLAKNQVVSQFGDEINVRKFVLLGDPAMKLAMPEYGVELTAVNGKLPGSDTLKSRSSNDVTGRITGRDGKPLQGFKGTVEVKIFDKPYAYKTLANDPQSRQVSFNQQESLLFHGKVPVVDGKFSYRFVLPTDASPQKGNLKFSHYADNGITDAHGATSNVFHQGFSDVTVSDMKGPDIEIALNSDKFKSGDQVNETPLLLLQLSDASGINLGGVGIGHDIIAILDDDIPTTMVLNDWFVPLENGSNVKGLLTFRLSALAEGKHTLKVKAWDVYNNSSESTVVFTVRKQKEVLISALSNYPNPFNYSTNFKVQLDGPTLGATLQLEIFNTQGMVVHRMLQTIKETGIRSMELKWDLKDNLGVPPARGLYFYRLVIRTVEGTSTQRSARLVIL